ncbi:MAG: DUF6055 domain-containing protein [Candidatus Woesearchaeota archaeon]
MKLKYASLAIALIVVLLFVASCGKQTAETISKSAGSTELSADEIDSVNDDELKSILNAPPLPEPKDTPFDVIDRQLSEGKIDIKQANVLRVIANFEPESLPKGYEGEQLGRNSYQEADIWLSKNWDALDADTKKLLEPYYYERDDPRNHMNAKTDTQKVADALSIIPSVNAAEELVVILTTTLTASPERKVRIFYGMNDPAQEQQANWTSFAFVKSFPMFEQMLGVRPDKMVYVYLENMGSYGSAAIRTLDNQTRCRIKLKLGMDQKMTESTLAHELFHCFQFAIPLDYDPKDEQWLMESTATWSEHYVYPAYNSEHEYLKRFFNKLDKYMMYYGLNHEYSTYMWHLFVTQSSNDISYVKDVLLKAKSGTSTDAVTKDPLFDSRFSEYAVWNWNINPYKRYADNPSLPGSPSGGEAYLEYAYSKDKESPEFEAVSPLGINYHMHTFASDIDKITFQFEEKGDEKKRRIALIKFEDYWIREDWTDISERTFCRITGEKMVTGVVLISSNADTDSNWDYEYKVKTKGECNPEWRGNVRVTWAFSNSIDYGIAQQTYTQEASMISNDILVFDSENDEFLVKEQHISYSHKEHQVTTYPDECGLQKTTLTNIQQGVGYGSWEIDEHNPSDGYAYERIEGEEGEYSLVLEVTPNQKGWLTSTSTIAKIYKPCGLEGLFTPSAQGSTTEVHIDKLDRMKYMLNPIKLKVSEDNLRMYASEIVDTPLGSQLIPVHVEADYRFG